VANKKRKRRWEREGCFYLPRCAQPLKRGSIRGWRCTRPRLSCASMIPKHHEIVESRIYLQWVLFLRKSRSISGIIYDNLILSNKKTQVMTEEPCSLMALQERGDDIMRMALHFNLLCTLWLAKLASSTRDKWYYDGDGQKWILRRSSFPFSRSSNGGDSINQ
jgi:hypothetical protein